MEDGYKSGMEQARHLHTGAEAREHYDQQYATRSERFTEGYAKGIRDGGVSGMTSSMYNLANRPNQPGFSSGYQQGFRDGHSGE